MSDKQTGGLLIQELSAILGAMTNTPVVKMLALVLASALLASACTSDPNEAGGQDASQDPSTTQAELADGSQQGAGEDQPAVEGSGGFSAGDFSAPTDIDDTPLSVDEAIRIGTLDNGLTYYVRSNDSPGSSVSLRLAIRAGGVHESPIGTGAAHFLEHMMFNGTERFPGNTLDDTLRSIGAEIGPDFNAFTSDTETVYQLDIEDRNDNVEIAFDVLSQWAAAASLEPGQVAAEAPVVREELRLRDESGDGLVNQAFDLAYFADTPFEGSNIIGTPETVNAITADDLRAFYDDWYRPDNMAVVAVGDRSLDDLEDLIVDRFRNLESRGTNPTAPDISLDQLRQEPWVDVVVEPSFADSFISVDIPVRTWDTSTVGGQELRLTDIILGIMIDNRLVEAVDSGRLDLRRAGGGWFPRNRGLSYLGFNLDADDLVEGTEVFLAELRSSVQNPFTQDELDRATEVIASSLDQQAASFNSTQDAQFADGMIQHFLGGGDLRSIDDSVDETRDFLDDLDIDEVNNHYGWLITSSAPIVIVVGPDAERTGTIEDVTAAIERGEASATETFTDDVAEIDDLLEDPEPVEEIGRRNLARNDGIELVFQNGARVLFSASTISEGEVFVVSESPGGRSVLSAADGALADVAVSAVTASGAGAWDSVQIRRFLSDLDISVAPYIADFSEGVSASGSSDDLQTLFELMHLQLTQPRVDDVPFRQQVEFARDFVARAGVDSATAADIALQDGRTGGGSLAAAPTLDALDALTPDQALNIWNDRFDALDDHVFVIVGDADEDTIVDLSRQWIGTLPVPTSQDGPEQPRLPGLLDERLSVGSGGASGSYRLLVVGESDETIRNQVLAELAATILNDRIFTVIREELGATYGGGAGVEFSDPGAEVELFISIDGDPGRVDEIAGTVTNELASIRGGQISQTDFDEAVSIVRSEYNFVTNGFYIESLFDEARESEERILTRQAQIEALESIDLDDLIDFFDDLVSDTDRVDVRNVPGG